MLNNAQEERNMSIVYYFVLANFRLGFAGSI